MKVTLLILLAALAVVTAASLLLRHPLTVGAVGMGSALVGAFACSDRLVRRRELTGRTMPVILIGTFLVSVAGIGNLPLRFAFHLCEGHIEALAHNLHEGITPDFPCRVGPLFIIEGVPSSESGTIFFVAGGDYLIFDPSERDYGQVSATRLSPRWVLVSQTYAAGE